MTDERARALTDIVALARRHDIAAAEIATALAGDATGGAGEPRLRGVLGRALSYLGATFVFAGLGVFIALQWSSMNAPARIVVTLGSGLAAFALAALASRDERFGRAAAPLFLVAGALEPTGMMVAFSELASSLEWNTAALVTCAAIAAQFAAACGAFRRSTPLFVAILFAALFCCTALDLLGADDAVIGLVVGASLLLAAVGLDRTAHAEITPIWYLAGSSAFLYGLFDAVSGGALEIVFLAVAAGFVYLATILRSRTMLFVATLAILAYTGWYTNRYFADSVGWPLALIAFGILMIALSAVAMRIDRRYIRGG